MTNPNSELEEGELMDQDPVLTTLEEMLKVSTFKNSFAIIHRQKILGLLTLIILSNQTSAFDPKEQLYANTANQSQNQDCNEIAFHFYGVIELFITFLLRFFSDCGCSDVLYVGNTFFPMAHN